MNRVYAPKAITLLSSLMLSIFVCQAVNQLPSLAQFLEQRSQLHTLTDRLLLSTATNQIKSPCKEKLIALIRTTRSLIVAEPSALLHRAIILNSRIATALDIALTNCQNKELLECLTKELEKSDTMHLAPDLTKTFEQTNTLITTINSRIDNWGATWLQRTARSCNTTLHDYKLDVMAKRALPYAVLGLTFLYINEAGKLESLNLPGLTTMKRIVGTCPQHPFKGLDTLQKMFNPAALLLTSVVMGDLKEAVAWSGNKLSAYWAWLQGRGYCTSPLFQSKQRFTDFVGNSDAKAQLQTLARYALIEKQAQAAGYPMTKGYLLIGDSATTQQYAHAFAAEITALQRTQATPKVCALYDLHASLLLTKSLDTIIKEVEDWSDANRTVIVINEIDWLFTLDKPDTKVTSELINSLAKIAKPSSKKEIIVIATASPAGAAKIHPALLTTNGLGIEIAIQSLTAQERFDLLKREITTKGLTCSEEFLAQFAQQLKEYQAPAIAQLVNQAFSLAQASQELFAEKHLTASLQLQSK